MANLSAIIAPTNVVTTTGTQTLTNKTLTGAIVNGTVGATTPSTGEFTTLLARGDSSNTTFTSSGQLAIKRSSSDPVFSFHNDAGSQIGNIQFQNDGVCGITVAVNQALVFKTNATERIRIPSDAGGITFPASQVASANANTLDDYEEGTFTPAVTGSTTNPTVSYNWRYGYYTKIGNQVTLWFGYNVASISSAGSGDLRVTIPFTSSNRSDNRIPGTVSGGVSYTAGSVLHISNSENSAYITFRQFNSTPAASTLSVSSLNGTGESVQMCIIITVD